MRTQSKERHSGWGLEQLSCVARSVQNWYSIVHHFSFDAVLWREHLSAYAYAAYLLQISDDVEVEGMFM